MRIMLLGLIFASSRLSAFHGERRAQPPLLNKFSKIVRPGMALLHQSSVRKKLHNVL